MSAAPSRRRFFGLAAAASLAGCSAPPRLAYALVAVPGTPDPGVATRIGIRSIGVPPALDQDEIAAPAAAYQVARFANDIWVEPLGQMLQSVMVQNLMQRLPAATVIAEGGAIGAPMAVLVEIDVLTFDPTPAGTVTLLAQIAIRPAAGAHPAYRTWTETDSATPATPDAAGMAAAMSMLWGRMADGIAARLTPPP